jgi:hypothetical protein
MRSQQRYHLNQNLNVVRALSFFVLKTTTGVLICGVTISLVLSSELTGF